MTDNPIFSKRTRRALSGESKVLSKHHVSSSSPEAVARAALEWAAGQAQSIDHHGWTRSQLAEIIRQGKNPAIIAAIIKTAGEKRDE